MPHNPASRNARSYRFDDETISLIDRLAAHLVDAETGRQRTATDVLRLSVRVLAGQKKILSKSQKG